MSEVTHTPSGGKPIVVGVDGSENSKEALRWAARQADLSGSPLVVTTSWSYPNSYGYPAPWPEDFDPESDAKRLLDDTIDEVLGIEKSTTVTRSVVPGHPALALEGASHAASLIVVGCRGHGEFTGMLLGSVSEFLTTHSHCPVVIVRGEVNGTDPPR